MAYGMHAPAALATVAAYRSASFWGLIPLGWAAWARLELIGKRPILDRFRTSLAKPHEDTREDARAGAPIRAYAGSRTAA